MKPGRHKNVYESQIDKIPWESSGGEAVLEKWDLDDDVTVNDVIGQFSKRKTADAVAQEQF